MSPTLARPEPKKVVRDFTYINSRRRRPSDYEALNLHVQPKLGNFWDLGHSYLRTPEGRPGFIAESTAIQAKDWFDFRDPSGMWQRPYMRVQAEQERAIERLQEDVSGLLQESLDRVWAREVLGKHYSVWSFVEYGLYRGLFSASREGLSDTIVASMLFETFDRQRHQQDIVRYLMLLEELLPELGNTQANDAWLAEERYQPLRQVVEQIGFGTRDWCEVVVATNLCFDLIASEVAVHRLIGAQAPFHGDLVSAFIAASVQRDRARDLAYTQEFVRMVCAPDVPAAAANREILNGWVATWTPRVLAAMEPIRAVYEALPTSRLTFADEIARARARQDAVLADLGLSPGA